MTWEFGLDCKLNPWFELRLQTSLSHPKQEARYTAPAAWSSLAPVVSEHKEQDSAELQRFTWYGHFYLQLKMSRK